MKRLICMYAFLLCLVCVLPAQEREVKLKIVQTSDVHGNYFPYNFITQKEWGVLRQNKGWRTEYFSMI